MGRSNAKIRQIELLLTLDYLLHHTDDHHPATQIDICEHAREYGLKFDKNESKGNEIKRQRISECLRLLEDIGNTYPDKVPFNLLTTDSGKYYIEQRNGLSEEQIAKILAAIKNDKYTKDGDVKWLTDCVLDAFSTTDENRNIIQTECKQLLRGGKKFDKETIRRMNLVERAYREGKMIKIMLHLPQSIRHPEMDVLFWYRVYMIKEFQNKPYAFLLPVGQIQPDPTVEVLRHNHYLFRPIEELDVAKGAEENVLCDDMDKNRDFDELFCEKCPGYAKKYKTIDKMLKKKILPKGGKTCIASFYFDLKQKDVLRRSFETFFSETFHYQETNVIQGIENQIQDLIPNMDNWTIVTEEVKKNETPKQGLVNISVDGNALKSWLLSDPYGDGQECILDLVTLIKPLSLNEEIAEYHYIQLMKRAPYLESTFKRNLIRALEEEPEIEDPEDDGIINDEDDDYFYMDNEYTRELDRSLKTKENLMIKGLPGCGKTSIVESWLRHHKEEVNGYYIDGGTLPTCLGERRKKNDLILDGQLFDSQVIDKILSMPHRVIVVDNYHLLSAEQKQHIALLLDGYVIDDREEDGFRRLDNIEFVCLIETTNY